MSDSLEKYIREHRKELDTANTPDFIWDNIQKELETSRNKSGKSRLFFLSGVAAGILLVVCVGAGYFWGLQVNHPTSPEIQAYRQQEKQMQHLVQVRMDQLQSYPIHPTVTADLEQLDGIYQELKADLTENSPGNSSEIIQALIENYQTKLEILEKILEKQKELAEEQADETLTI